jgi:retron-type reverse transcriptase
MEPLLLFYLKRMFVKHQMILDRSVSFIHSFAKLISKALALWLAPHMDNLVSYSQSAIIKHRCIQDNFLYVRNLARAYHRKKTHALLLKLDITKAFDSVSWAYLLEMMQ